MGAVPQHYFFVEPPGEVAGLLMNARNEQCPSAHPNKYPSLEKKYIKEYNSLSTTRMLSADLFV